MENNEKILEVENLHVSFHTYAGEVKAVRGVDFELNTGRDTCVCRRIRMRQVGYGQVHYATFKTAGCGDQAGIQNYLRRQGCHENDRKGTVCIPGR